MTMRKDSCTSTGHASPIGRHTTLIHVLCGEVVCAHTCVCVCGHACMLQPCTCTLRNWGTSVVGHGACQGTITDVLSHPPLALQEQVLVQKENHHPSNFRNAKHQFNKWRDDVHWCGPAKIPRCLVFLPKKNPSRKKTLQGIGKAIHCSVRDAVTIGMQDRTAAAQCISQKKQHIIGRGNNRAAAERISSSRATAATNAQQDSRHACEYIEHIPNRPPTF